MFDRYLNQVISPLPFCVSHEMPAVSVGCMSFNVKGLKKRVFIALTRVLGQCGCINAKIDPRGGRGVSRGREKRKKRT